MRGSGATHLSVALANYAASGLNERTAYLELDGHGEMRHWKETDETGRFKDSGIDYFPDCAREDIPILWNRDYDKIIMDFGNAYIRFREELLRCDRRVFLLNLNPWQTFAARNMVSAVMGREWGGIMPLYVSVNAQRKEKRAIEKEFQISVTDLPVLSNPKRVRSDEFPCMDFLIGGPAAGLNKRRLLIPIRKRR